ncbi:MAG: hypothetical protein IPM46_01295 [Flavobacteriales bacterium]|nr:hypothetical protein [Flavobacteriales bacterium]
MGGGYKLQINSAQILIDNSHDNFGNGGFTSGQYSQIDGNEGFCLPISTDRLIFANCGKLDWRTACGSEYMVANDNGAVTAQYNANPTTYGYQAWWYNPNGGYSFKRTQYHSTPNGLPASATRACHFKLNSWSGEHHGPGLRPDLRRGRAGELRDQRHQLVRPQRRFPMGRCMPADHGELHHRRRQPEHG